MTGAATQKEEREETGLTTRRETSSMACAAAGVWEGLGHHLWGPGLMRLRIEQGTGSSSRNIDQSREEVTGNTEKEKLTAYRKGETDGFMGDMMKK